MVYETVQYHALPGLLHVWHCCPSRWQPHSETGRNHFTHCMRDYRTTVAHKRSWSFCRKCRWQVTAKYGCTLHTWLCMKWHGAWLHGIHRTCRDDSSFMWHQPCQHRKYTTLVDIQKRVMKKRFTHAESLASAVSLLESREEHYIKVMNNKNYCWPIKQRRALYKSDEQQELLLTYKTEKSTIQKWSTTRTIADL